jgi:hypothetical protein
MIVVRGVRKIEFYSDKVAVAGVDIFTIKNVGGQYGVKRGFIFS